MSRQATLATVLLAGLVVTGPAFAGEDVCPAYPDAQWMTKEQLADKAAELGYEVRQIKAEDGCWEVKGYDKDGNRVEVYFDPVSAEVKKIKS